MWPKDCPKIVSSECRSRKPTWGTAGSEEREKKIREKDTEKYDYGSKTKYKKIRQPKPSTDSGDRTSLKIEDVQKIEPGKSIRGRQGKSILTAEWINHYRNKFDIITTAQTTVYEESYDIILTQLQVYEDA